MKNNRINIKEKRRYAIKKVSGKTASVFVGATIFGIFLGSNLGVINTKADTVSNATDTATVAGNQINNESNTVTLNGNQSNSISNSPTTNSVQNENLSTDNTEKSTSSTDSSASSAVNDAVATTSSTARMATEPTTGTGSDRNAAGTVDENNSNTQETTENQARANETGLTSADNYSSNIYKGTDGKDYKIVTIYGKDYVYRPADIQANGTAFGQGKTTVADTKNNIQIAKEDLGGGKTRWTVVFFPNKGLQNVGYKLSGLSSAKFGIAITSDYEIVGDVDVTVDTQQGSSYKAVKYDNNTATEYEVISPLAQVKQSFNPQTDVDKKTGLINSDSMNGLANDYMQGPYYFTADTAYGRKNLWQTFFKEDNVKENAYDNQDYVGGVHDFWANNFTIRNKAGEVDGGSPDQKIMYDTLNGQISNKNGVINTSDFNKAMEFKSQGKSGDGYTQFASYTVSFVTQHTDSYQTQLPKGTKNQQFSGISANIYSYQNAYYNMYSYLKGEQRALTSSGALVQPKDVISNWQTGEDALAKIKQDYLNDEQINDLRNQIHNNVSDQEKLAQIVENGNNLNDAMKELGNSLGMYDEDGSLADHDVETTKNTDRYKLASQEKRDAYDKAVEAAKSVVDKQQGKYADAETVKTLTENVKNAWNALDGEKTNAESIDPTVPEKTKVNDTSKLTDNEKAEVKTAVEEANKDKFPAGTDVTVGDTGDVTVTYPDGSKDTISGTDLVRPAKDNEKYTVEAGTPVDLTHGKTIAIGDELDPKSVVVKDSNGSPVELPVGSKVVWVEAPNTSEVGNGKTGQVKVVYGDGTESEPVAVTYNVTPNQADSTTPTIPEKQPAVDVNNLTDAEKDKVKQAVEDANKDDSGKSTLPEGTTVEVGNDGTTTVTYPDSSKDTISGTDLVRSA
ncbi:LEA family epithelial adhesin, partial [Lactobacillus salivarius]|nr:LEA family epithelial adhesin [Ligilactobacillus salivarius]